MQSVFLKVLRVAEQRATKTLFCAEADRYDMQFGLETWDCRVVPPVANAGGSYRRDVACIDHAVRMLVEWGGTVFLRTSCGKNSRECRATAQSLRTETDEPLIQRAGLRASAGAQLASRTGTGVGPHVALRNSVRCLRLRARRR